MTLSFQAPDFQVHRQPNVDAPMTTRAHMILHRAADQRLYLPNTTCQVRQSVPLSSLTSLRVGGPADWFIAPHSSTDIMVGLRWAAEAELPVTVLGAGSNLLVSDRGLPGLVIGMRQLRNMEFDEATGQVTVDAGVSLAKLAWRAAERGWRGLEWAVGIPGTVGGAVVMNAGAHGREAADILVSTQVVDPDGSSHDLRPTDLDYRYRTSNLQGRDRLVTQATFQLQPGFDPVQVTRDTTTDLDQRRASQPYHLPSCGSVFRNPSPQAAGWLIEQSGLKGFQVGQAQVAEQHANFILNLGGAKAGDVFRVIQEIQTKVQDQWAVLLKPEVKILGDFAGV